MLAALFPKAGIEILAWIALVPLIIVARSAAPRAAACYGFMAGVVFFGILIEWARIFDVTAWILATLLLAAYVAAFAFLVRLLSPSHTGWRGVVAPAAIWTTLEWLRGLGSFGFTWGGLAYALHDQLLLVQLASLTGPLGITFLIAVVNAAVAGAVVALIQPIDRSLLRAALGRLALAAGLLLSAWGWGHWRLAQPPSPGETVRVAVLQGNVFGEGTDEPWDMARVLEIARIYLGLSEEAARLQADIVIWPETAVPDYLLLNPAIHEEIASVAARLGVNLVVGGSHREPDGRRFNSAFLFARDGQLTGRYDKVHLVPYGEYTPGREALAFLYRHFPIRPLDYTSGRGFFPLATDAGSVGVAICFESAFPHIARALRNSGAQMLAVMTNDAWFGYSAATWQHYHMARFRAVESGSYLLRAATTGYSAILDPRGRLLAETTLYTRRILLGEVRQITQATPYMRIGDLVAWVCALAVAVMLIAMVRARLTGGGRRIAGDPV